MRHPGSQIGRPNRYTTGIPARIPFADVLTPHIELQEELLAVFRVALGAGIFVGGSMVEDFERDFAQYCGTRYCVGVSSGTDALTLALIAVGVRTGDIVLTVPNAFVATAEAISRVGARLDFIDIDERTYNIDWLKLEDHLKTRCYRDFTTGKLVDSKTQKPITAVVPVHLYGQPADMDPILEIGERYHLIVVEDARQAHGAEYFSKKENRWRKAGSMGRAAAFSFSPRSNLGACGKAGAVTTDDAELAKEVWALRDRSKPARLHGDVLASDSQLDAIQAGILQVKLEHLAEWNKKRRENAFCYHGLLANVAGGSLSIPHEPSWARSTYDSYVIRTHHRDELQSYLHEADIPTEIQPVPLHLQADFRDTGYSVGAFPATEKVASEVLSLPIYPRLEFDQQYRIAQRISEFVAESSAGNIRSFRA